MTKCLVKAWRILWQLLVPSRWIGIIKNVTISLSQVTGIYISPFSSLLIYLFIHLFSQVEVFSLFPFRNCMRWCSTFTFKDLVKSLLFNAHLKLLTQTSPWNAMECLRMAEWLYKHSVASMTKTFRFLIYIHHNTTLFSCFSFSEPLNYYFK